MGWAERANTNPNKGKEKPQKVSGKRLSMAGILPSLLMNYGAGHPVMRKFKK